MRSATARRACHGLLLTVACASGFGVGTVQAAATKKVTLSGQDARTFVAWNRFLAGGTPTWSARHAPDFSPMVRSTIWQIVKSDTQAEQLANPMIDYLLWRRSLNVRRFATYHPYLNPRLAQLLNSSPTLPSGAPAPQPPTAVSPQDLTGPKAGPTPSTPSTTTPPAPSDPIGQTVSPPSVPEPSSLVLAATMTGMGLWWRHRIGREQRSRR
ncbi:hypothetical protein OJF2_15830 [Aquisphaera giovannonii]|uniref:PEP-CTERM protein-sorting domain-containing protein n=1 Tax=Aquisphaera giovannonii TaxID=406548 RepID=A0A5B9VXI3_9BACT|nr:PEP-CTERM sorting domain-containing protein [Aquisphaera giovannonii]QEH33086.1 hypothetical protein OJF2_15830 [Aquisphaera giovannonii]